MIELKLIPDGAAEVPAEAKDHGILASNLEGASNIPDNANAAINGWRDIERVVPGNGEYIVLRVPGTVSDYPGNTLDGIQSAIVNNINGLKEHPDGWEVVEQS
jgi:hypothetical protein